MLVDVEIDEEEMISELEDLGYIVTKTNNSHEKDIDNIDIAIELLRNNNCPNNIIQELLEWTNKNPLVTKEKLDRWIASCHA